MKCEQCGIEMKKQDYQHPYITHSGKTFTNIKVDVFVCPECGLKKEKLPNHDDGYSVGEGLFSDD